LFAPHSSCSSFRQNFKIEQNLAVIQFVIKYPPLELITE